MKFNLTRIDNKTPFKVTVTDALQPDPRPTLIMWPTQGYNPKSRAAGDGFVFHEKNVAIEIALRLVAQILATWPEEKERIKRLLAMSAEGE